VCFQDVSDVGAGSTPVDAHITGTVMTGACLHAPHSREKNMKIPGWSLMAAPQVAQRIRIPLPGSTCLVTSRSRNAQSSVALNPGRVCTCLISFTGG
jgi:hypothetical protein